MNLVEILKAFTSMGIFMIKKEKRKGKEREEK